MSRRLFTCPACSGTWPIDATQAGETVGCPHCGKPISLPTLLQIRKLPSAEEPTPSPDGLAERWSPPQGIAFSVGTVLLLAGAATAAYFAWHLPPTFPPPKLSNLLAHPNYPSEQLGPADMDTLSPRESLERWEQLNEPLPNDRSPRPFFLLVRDARNRYLVFLYAGSAAAVIGVTLMLGAWLAPLLRR